MYELVKCTDSSQWNAAIKLSPQYSIFSKSEYLESCELRADKWFLYKNKKIFLAALVIEPNNPSFRAPYPYSAYQGLYFIDNHQELHSQIKSRLDALTELLDNFSGLYKNLSFSLHYSINDIRAFQWFNYGELGGCKYKIDIAYTGIVDINKFGSIDEYLKKIRKSRLQEYRKAESKNMKFTISPDIEIFIDLYIKTFERQGIVVKEENLKKVKNIVNSALKYNYGNIFLCLDENDTPVAASVFLYDNEYAYYLFGASDPSFRNSGASAFLMLNIFSYFYSNGVYKFDMVGINSPQRGDYKISYNADVFSYFNLALI